MQGNPATAIAEIAALLGPAGVITEPSEKAGYERGARYGDVRRQLLGLEVVLADSEGTRLDLMRGLRKDNTGVDLKQLFVGTSGAFGIITSAILEVHPLPRQRACALLIPRSAEAATDVLRGLEQRCGELLTSRLAA